MMNNSTLYGSEWLNIVFNNRNQQYGAYALRRQSSAIIVKALLITVPVFVLFFVGPVVYNRLFPAPMPPVDVAVQVTLSEPIHELKQEEPKKDEPKKELAKKELPKVAAATPKLKTTNFSSNIVVVDKEVADPPTTIDLQQGVIASITQEGEATRGNAGLNQGIGTGSNETGGEAVGNGNEIYAAAGVEVYPEFPGGMAAWAKFIQRNLKYPYAAQESSIQGKVYLSFVVEKDGAITDVSVIRGIGYGCDEEAVRVIKKSPRWKPGMQNNQMVRVRYTMPIGYVMQ